MAKSQQKRIELVTRPGWAHKQQSPTGWGYSQPRTQQQQHNSRPSQQGTTPKKSSPIYQPTHVKLPGERGEADGGTSHTPDTSTRYVHKAHFSSLGYGFQCRPYENIVYIFPYN